MLSCQHQLTNFAGLCRCPPRRNSRDRLDPHVERVGWLSTPGRRDRRIISAAVLFIGTGYIALDTGFSWTGYWDSTLTGANRGYALYTLYLLAPLVFICIFFLLETFLVLRILGERKPMSTYYAKSRKTVLTVHLVYLIGAALCFAIAQIFQFVASVHICNGTSGKINGGMFETLFTLLAVSLIWVFWSSITEDDWPMPSVAGGSGAYS
jgi:hypothetical protein